MARIIVPLTMQEKEALVKLAEQELRDPRAQAALLIREELRRRGLLPATQIGEPLNAQETD